ncbi:DgyrCDS5476 [Dimorphilus gyrociliatus]|uniref:DgyrCDS5476 n=1 Tax=Dimorphilus gyrociliatus TaxID=2664684 RepID=A0A7I8VMP2_9ANNE|nr:DgyrCDS5476 [Dimorphilus gyrociliatus]
MVDAIRNFSTWENHSNFDASKKSWYANWGKSNGVSTGGMGKVLHGQPPSRRSFEDKNRSRPNYNNEAQDIEPAFKVKPSYIPKQIMHRPFTGKCCSCLPVSRSAFLTEEMEKKQLFNLIDVSTTQNKSMLTRKFSYLAFALQKKMPFTYPDVSHEVLSSSRVLDAIKESALRDCPDNDNDLEDSQLEEQIRKHTRRARKIIDGMQARISNAMLRLAGWFLHHFFNKLVSSVTVHQGQVDMLLEAAKQGKPIILLPTHKSHVDYLLVSWLLFKYGIKAPHVAAGDNLSIPFFGWLLNGLGGFYIRRKLDPKNGVKDIVYRSVLHVYIQELLRRNENFEIFFEGGRSRSGKICYPKAGLLSVILDSFHEGVFADALIVPVSINYDKILDGNFNREQMGKRKISESFFIAVKSIISVFCMRYGNIRLDISQPFSLKEFDANAPRNLRRRDDSSVSLNSSYNRCSSPAESPVSDSSSPVFERSLSFKNRHRQSSASLYGTDMVVQEQQDRNEVLALAEHVTYSTVVSQSAMSTQLVAFLLLVKFRNGVYFSELCRVFEKLKLEVNKRGRDVGFSGETKDVVLFACRLLGEELMQVSNSINNNDIKNVGDADFFIKPITTLPTVFELTYYSNPITYIFALESILATVIWSKIPAEKKNSDDELNFELSEDSIIEEATDLCNLLKYDFILCPACKDVREMVESAVQSFIEKGLLHTIEEAKSQNQDKLWMNRVANDLGFESSGSDGDDVDFKCRKYKLILGRDKVSDRLKFLKKVLESYFECYTNVSKNLVKLREGDKPELDFLKEVHESLKDSAVNGKLRFPECAALDIVKTSLRSFHNRKVIDLYLDETVRKCGLSRTYRRKDRLDKRKTDYDQVANAAREKTVAVIQYRIRSGMERSLLRRCPNCGISVKDDKNDGKNEEEKELSGLPKDFYDFASKSTLHGLRNVSDGSRNQLRRVIWFAIVVAGLTLLLYSLISQIVLYFRYEVTTSINVKEMSEMLLPAVTQVLQALQELTHQAEQMILSCSFNNILIEDCHSMFVPMITDAGICYTASYNTSFKARELSTDNNLVIRLNVENEEYYYGESSTAGFRILIHNRMDEEPLLIVRRAFSVAPGTTTFASVHLNKNIRMAPPYGKCRPENSLSLRLAYYKNYSLELCKHEARANFTVETCRCRWYNDPGTFIICQSLDELLCARQAREKFSSLPNVCKLACISEYYDVKTSIALFPGQHIINDLQVKYNVSEDYISKNFAEVRIQYDDLAMTVIEQKAVYGFTTLFADLGGQMGICLGASLLSIVEIIDFIVTAFLRRINN